MGDRRAFTLSGDTELPAAGPGIRGDEVLFRDGVASGAGAEGWEDAAAAAAAARSCASNFLLNASFSAIALWYCSGAGGWGVKGGGEGENEGGGAV